MRAGIDAGLAISGRQLNGALIQRTGFFRSIQAVLADVDFILTPCASAPALAADHAIDAPLVIAGREMGEIRREWLPYLSLFDLSGHPALAMPAVSSSSGAGAGRGRCWRRRRSGRRRATGRASPIFDGPIDAPEKGGILTIYYMGDYRHGAGTARPEGKLPPHL
jgi:hypothetical protein